MPQPSTTRPKSQTLRRPNTSRRAAPAPGAKPPHEILFQTYFKSVGPRTYASQLMRANNGNHYLVLTEGKRDEATGEVRKTKLFVFSEDFKAFFGMLQETAQSIRAHPVPDEIKQRRDRFWSRKGKEGAASSTPAVRTSAPPGRRVGAPNATAARTVTTAGRPFSAARTGR